eukprot:TRINITY_DN4021_c0_g1_i1.p1 TRINITY_DN4021_c0_g1~~TRINITY_DN4021_c0_g1_i1.p1  ORF type:complete len:621 (-),score=202.91 TRINITY_DN4021_c0_g1_i1:9-1871(-)
MYAYMSESSDYEDEVKEEELENKPLGTIQITVGGVHHTLEFISQTPTIEKELKFSSRAVLYRWDGSSKEWKERGHGPLRIFINNAGKPQLLMRRDIVLNLCANHILMPTMELSILAQNPKVFVWRVLGDYIKEGEPSNEIFSIKFASIEAAENFREAFNACKNGKEVEMGGAHALLGEKKEGVVVEKMKEIVVPEEEKKSRALWEQFGTLNQRELNFNIGEKNTTFVQFPLTFGGDKKGNDQKSGFPFAFKMSSSGVGSLLVKKEEELKKESQKEKGALENKTEEIKKNELETKTHFDASKMKNLLPNTASGTTTEGKPQDQTNVQNTESGQKLKEVSENNKQPPSLTFGKMTPTLAPVLRPTVPKTYTAKRTTKTDTKKEEGPSLPQPDKAPSCPSPTPTPIETSDKETQIEEQPPIIVNTKPKVAQVDGVSSVLTLQEKKNCEEKENVAFLECANHPSSWIASDSSEGKAVSELFYIRFLDRETAVKFKTQFDVSKMKNVLPNVESGTTTEVKSTSTPLPNPLTPSPIPPPTIDIHSIDTNTLAQQAFEQFEIWFKRLILKDKEKEVYFKMFVESGFDDLEIIAQIEKTDFDSNFKQIPLGHRMKIWNAIQSLKAPKK